MHSGETTAEIAKPRQLSLWDELEIMRGLVAGTAHGRMAACQDLWLPAARGVSAADPDAHLELRRSELGHWTACGLASCNGWGCPHCGRIRAARARDETGAVIVAHRAASPLHDAWMLTLAPPHYDAGVGVDVERLYDAEQRLVRDREYQRWCKRWGIVGRVRFLDGSGGAHPHFHVLLLPTAAVIGLTHPTSGMGAVERATWLEHIGAELVPIWERACRGAGVEIRDVDAFHRHSLKLTGGESAARYFAAWGLVDEVSLGAIKRSSHLMLLAKVAAGDQDAGARFLGWLDATHGRQWVTGLSDVRRRLGVDDDDVDAYAERRRELMRKHKPRALVEPLSIRIPAELVSTALAVGIRTVVREADDAHASGVSAQRAVLSLLWRAELARRRWRRSRPPPS